MLSLMKQGEEVWLFTQWSYLSYEAVYCKGLPDTFE
jgi:hypothetical protein